MKYIFVILFIFSSLHATFTSFKERAEQVPRYSTYGWLATLLATPDERNPWDNGTFINSEAQWISYTGVVTPMECDSGFLIPSAYSTVSGMDNYNGCTFSCSNISPTDSVTLKDGTTVSADSFCHPCNPLSSLTAPLSEAQCSGNYSNDIIKSSTLGFQTCDSTCYVLEPIYNTCDDAYVNFLNSCNTALNDYHFSCDSITNPPTVVKSCFMKQDECDVIADNILKNCKSPNVISGECNTTNGIMVNTFSCDAPINNGSPCDIDLQNMLNTCNAPSYIVGSCTDSVDGTTIATNTRSCFLPPPDINTTDNNFSAKIINQTNAITSSLNNNFNSVNNNLNKNRDTLNGIDSSIQTSNSKLDSLIFNNQRDFRTNSNAVKNMNSNLGNKLNNLINNNIQNSDALATKLDDIKKAISDKNILPQLIQTTFPKSLFRPNL